MQESTSIRPTETDLLSESYDQVSTGSHSKTLIVCSAPRTGSNDLCRLLLASGIGIPFEYFNPLFVRVLAARWRAQGAEPDSVNIEAYINALTAKRSVNGVFAFKVQYPDFERFLCNRCGESLLDGAVFVHLFRPDAVAQFESYYIARRTGKWDYTSSQTTVPEHLSSLTPDQLRNLMEALFLHDTKFRVLFAMLGIRPIYLSMDDLFSHPKEAIRRIAEAMGVAVNETQLDEAIATSKRYARTDQDAALSIDFRGMFKPIIFRRG